MSKNDDHALFIEALLPELPPFGDATIDAARAKAAERARALGVPGAKDEEWRFIKLRPVTETAFTPVSGPAPEVNHAAIAPFLMEEAEGSRIVFIDGSFHAGLTSLDGVGDGVRVCTLAEAIETDAPGISSALGKLVALDDVFAAANQAALGQGAYVHIDRETSGERPIHVLHVSTGRGRHASFPRLLLHAARGSKLLVIEEHVGFEGEYLAAPVTEITVEANANVRYVKIQEESPAAFHIARTFARVEGHGNLASFTITLGAKLSRHTVSVVQMGEGAHSELDGLAVLDDRQVADTHTVTDHKFANCTSGQVHKIIADGRSQGVFNGKIFVREGSQKIAAEQLNRNLLLSRKASVNTKPQLEIFADDVRCTHGATIGQLDDEQLFYLRSRGMDEATSRAVLTYAFAGELIDTLSVDSVRARLRKHIGQLFEVETR